MPPSAPPTPRGGDGGAVHRYGGHGAAGDARPGRCDRRHGRPRCRRRTSPLRPGCGRWRRRGDHRRHARRRGPGVDGRAARRMGRSSLVFGFVAVFVGAFIINNTFSITVAQRTREMAMLRAIGASGRQVKRSVLIEAVVIGALASGRPRRRHRCGRRAAAADVGVRVRHARRAHGHLAQRDGPSFAVGRDRDRAVGVAARPPGRQDRPIAALRDVSVDRSAARLAGPSSARPSRLWVWRRCLPGSAVRSPWSVSVRWRRSSACRCSVRCSPARSPRCSACRCGCVAQR